MQAVCIADADWHYIVPDTGSCSLLLLTDYTSMEMYAFSKEILNTILVTVSPGTASSGEYLWSALLPPLQSLFAICVTNFDLQLRLEWLESIEKFISFEGGTIAFDETEFLHRYLVIRTSATQVSKFMIRLTEIRALFKTDPRFQVRGHDFVKLFALYLRKIEKRRHLNDEAVRHLLYIALQPERLRVEPLFISLLLRISSAV